MSNSSTIVELKNLLEELLAEGGVKKLFCGDKNAPGDQVPQGNISVWDRLAVPLSGCHRMRLPVRGKVIEIEPRRHNATFMHAGNWNCPDWILPVKVVTFAFLPKYFSFNLVDCPGKTVNVHRYVRTEQINWKNSTGIDTLNLLREIILSDSEDPRCILLVETLLYSCIESLKQPGGDTSGKARATFNAICVYLDEWYNSELSRDGVAERFRISPNYLSNLFKSQSGISFNKYITRLRIRQASYLLKNYNQTLDEIALNCGFNETSYFCTVFRQTTGMTPSEYRRQ